MEYIAFLRGINIGGKNKIAMADLRTGLEQIQLTDISTYLNSGNVKFESFIENESELRNSIETMIQNRFGLLISVYVMTVEQLRTTLAHAPVWWGTEDKNQYDNLILILSKDSTKEIADMVGPVSDGLEQVHIDNKVIFWTFHRNAYQKCNWWKKTADVGIAEKLTIRTANTVKKMI